MYFHLGKFFINSTLLWWLQKCNLIYRQVYFLQFHKWKVQDNVMTVIATFNRFCDVNMLPALSILNVQCWVIHSIFYVRKYMRKCVAAVSVVERGKLQNKNGPGVNLWLQLTVIFNMRSYLKYKDIIIVPLGSRSLSSSDHSGFTKKWKLRELTFGGGAPKRAVFKESMHMEFCNALVPHKNTYAVNFRP